MKRKLQLELLKKQKDGYGGELRNTREGRRGPRPIDTKHTMHVVLRSSKAKGSWSFATKANRSKIEEISNKFALKYGIKIHSCANVGNHLHYHLKLANRHTYKPFIRALTSAIMMAVTGASRWNSLEKMLSAKGYPSKSFWDYRPFSKVVATLRYLLNLKDYLQINELEGLGCDRDEARFIINDVKIRPWKYRSG